MTQYGQELSLLASGLERNLASKGVFSDDPFEEEPVPLDRWLADPYYIELGFTPGPEQLNALRHVEWIYHPETWEALGWVRPDVKLVNFICLKWGKGSGKDTISQVGLLRIAYLLQCLRSPQGYYGIGLHSPIHLTNIAVSAPQANNVFYSPLKELIKASSYFKGRANTGATKTTFDKGIELLSGHSDVASQEGMNLLAGVADEISEFKTKEELEKSKTQVSGGRAAKQSAESIDNMIRSSGRSRFPQVHKALYLSWTRFKGDYISRLYAEGLAAQEKDLAGGVRTRWWVSHKATWEANPSKFKSDFDDEYERDAENARGKYECNPPDAEDAFIKNKVALGLAFPERARNPVEHVIVEGPDPDVPGQYGWQAAFIFADEFQPVHGVPYAVHIDLAHTGDKAGFAMCHVSGKHGRDRDEADETRLITMPEITLDLAHQFAQGPHGEIELRWARQLVFRLVERGFNIKTVTLDGYQSVDTIQMLNAALASRNPQLPAEKRKVADYLSVDRNTEAYDTLKSAIYSQLFKGYRLPICGEGATAEECIWFREMKGLQRIGGLSLRAKIDHQPYGSKDVSDAIAGATVGALNAYRLWGISDVEDLWTGGANDSASETGPLNTPDYEMTLGGIPGDF